MNKNQDKSPGENQALLDVETVGIAGTIAKAFIDSKLTPLFVISSILLGIGATLLLPREEEPQIKVPMIDVLVSMPGTSAKEMEERVTRPMEKLLWEIPGVEYVYSTSKPEQSLVIVRFKVGSDLEQSLVKLNQKLQSNYDLIPFGASQPLVKARTIDDVPILAVTFHSKKYDHFTLRRLVTQVDDEVKQIANVSETTVIGGNRRTVRIFLDPARLASRNLSPVDLVSTLQQANRQSRVGALTSQDQELVIETGGFFKSAEDVANTVVGLYHGRPIYLKDVAEIVDGPEEPSQYVLFGRGGAFSSDAEEEPAVTLSVAKRRGANAIAVVRDVLRKIDSLRGYLIPADVEYTVTRDYGATAQEKSNELLFHMAIAVFSVALLILLTLGWRESVITLIAIPCTLALTLLVFYLIGFTLNRVTLFALIFSIGILVDDAIVVVENIVRHFYLPQNRGRRWHQIAVEAVSEVGNPTILATLAVIAAVLPMAFVGGLMGPYMRPIPIGASAAMFWSMLVAFMVTPWASIRILAIGTKYRLLTAHPTQTEPTQTEQDHRDDLLTKLYRQIMGPLICGRRLRMLFLATVIVLLVAAVSTVLVGWVRVKMLPFDNKSEFQIVLNMPEGSSLERTAQCAREIAAAVREEPEVLNYQIYAGTAAPFNFNGLVRHYFMRRGANVACIQVNLVPKHERKAQSHEIAKRVRPKVTAIAQRYNARVAVAEVPPGPPVLQTLVAEIYGPNEEVRLKLAHEVIRIFKQTPAVVDVDWYIEEGQSRLEFVIDREKAALHGISVATIVQTLQIATGGLPIDLVHIPNEKEDVQLVLEVPRQLRTHPEDLLSIQLRGGYANALSEPSAGLKSFSPLIPLWELVTLQTNLVENSIYHKNLKPVTYVVADVAGVAESPIYAILKMNRALRKLDMRHFSASKPEIKIYNFHSPFTTQEPSIKWDGEWHITIEVFRDLGIAFAAVLVLIYILMVGWFRSFITPFIVMAAIPFSLIGILPAHRALDAFFTATSMIGFMAGAGIVVRNSIILVDFIELRLAEGMPIAEAVVDAGAVRFRPMLLTAMAVVVGSAVILFDPIFQGMALSLMAGEIASLLISRMAVPVLYFMVYANNPPISCQITQSAAKTLPR